MEKTLSLPASPKVRGAAVGALVLIAIALIIAGLYTSFNGQAIAVSAAAGVVAIAVAVFTVTRALRRLRLPSSNDAWIFW
jgi:hypothetical protein